MSRTMQCPVCSNKEMEKGDIYLKKSWIDWIFFGLGFSELYIKSKDKEKIILWGGSIRTGYNCDQCHTSIIISESQTKN